MNEDADEEEGATERERGRRTDSKTDRERISLASSLYRETAKNL